MSNEHTVFAQAFYSGEAIEAHEILDDKGIPREKEDANGQIEVDGKKYYILPLVDRIQIYVEKLTCGS